MEGSRMRTLLGAGLVLLGGLLLFRALVSPFAFVREPLPPAAREVEQLTREEQQAQIDMRRAELEAQREIRLAELDRQRELRLAELEAQRVRGLDEIRSGADAPALPEVPALPAAPAIPPLPPTPPLPPAPPLLHLGAWLNPTVVLLILLALLIWRRGGRDREGQQA